MRFAVLVLAALLAAPPARAEVLFHDDFKGFEISMPDGSRKVYPDRQKWAFTFWPGIKWPDSYGDGTNWLGSANGECQAYLTPFIGKVKEKRIPLELRYDPFSIQPDGLHIKASVLTPEQQRAYKLDNFRRFGSGILVSRKSFTYGKFRMVAKLPSARGSWPAFWLLPSSRAWPPEIDVFEGMVWGPHESEIHLGVLPTKEEGKPYLGWHKLGVNPSRDFHEYGLDWNEKTITFLFDGQVLATQPTPPSMKQPMYMLVNLAVGGKWAYNELGVKPIDSLDPERLSRGSSLIESDYPAELVIKSIQVSD